MATNTATEDGLLCHCEHDPAGHPIEACGFTLGRRTVMGPGRIPSFGYDRPSDTHPHGYSFPKAQGTCPTCSKTVGVDRMPVTARPPAGIRDVTLGHRPAIRTHRVKGAVCSGVGRVPTETHYRESALLADYAA